MSDQPPAYPSRPEAGASAPRRVAVNSALQAGADIVGKLGSLVLYGVMVRQAGAGAFGDFTTAASLAVFVLMTSGMGMDYRLTRLVARGDPAAGDTLRAAILLKTVIGVAIMAIVLSVAALGPYDDRVLVATAILTVSVLLDGFIITVQAVFRGVERMGPVAASLLLYRLVLTSAGTGALILGTGITVVAVIWLGSSAVALTYLLLKLRRLELDLSGSLTTAGLRLTTLDSVPLGIATLFTAIITRLDIVLIGVIKDSEEVAVYGAAYRLLESTSFLPIALGLAVFPLVSRLSETTAPTALDVSAMSTKMLLFVLAPVAIAFWAFARPVIDLVYGSSLSEGYDVLRMLAPTVVLGGVSTFLGFVLASQRRQWAIALALGAGVVVNVGVNLLLIPPYGAKGAAAAMVLTTIVMCLGQGRGAWRALGRTSMRRLLLAPLAAAIAMAAVIAALGDSPMMSAPALAAFVAVAYAVERKLHPEDARVLLRALRPDARTTTIH